MFRSRKDRNVCELLTFKGLKTRRYESSIDENGREIQVLVTHDVTEDSALQLDPRAIEISSLLEQGINIDPNSVGDLLSENRFSVLSRYSQEYLADKFEQVRDYVETNKVEEV